METKLRNYAIVFFVGVFLLAVLWPYEAKLVHWDLEPDFNVLESDEIYFNNTRSLFYRIEESDSLKKQGFRIHRFTKQYKDTLFPILNFTIVNHWRNDRAYILGEPIARAYWEDTITLSIADTTFDIFLNSMDFEEHYQLAATLFRYQLAYERPYIIENNDSLSLYGTRENENANLTVLKDYFRLVGRFQ